MGSNSYKERNVFKDMPPNNEVKYKTISLADVLSENSSFQITTRTEIEDLAGSIRRIGVMHPPVLIGNSSGYIIVCGFRRIAACRSLGWTQITARILEETVDRFKMVQLAIADNAFQRSLNLVETSRALKLLSDFGSNQKQVSEAAVTIGLPISPSVAPKIKEICQLPLPIQEAILAGAVNMSMALELGRLDPAASGALVWLFDQLKVGLNIQRELLLLLKEISKREDLAIEQLITENPLKEIIKNTEIDRSLKRRKIKLYLRRRRFPAISKAETEYENLVKELKLGQDIHLAPPKDFEGTTFKMTLRFNNRQELIRLKKRLEKIIQHPDLGKILN